MKKVLIIGDSISKGYDKFVKAAFKESAEVFSPTENCRFSPSVFRHFTDWLKASGFNGDEVDCVHWNAGLWDCLIIYEEGNLIPIEMYELFIGRICRLIKRVCPNAKIIFATSTPVNEAGYGKNFKRFNKDIEAYNEVALRIVKEYGFAVNDLYGLLKDAPPEYHSDMTHYYTEAATKKITEKVCSAITEAIGILPGEVDYSTYFKKKDEIVGI